MALDDSERAHARRWIEHARSPQTESTPRAADAAEGGEIALEKRLGHLGIAHLLDDHQAWAHRLTKEPGHLRRLGQELQDRIDFEELPSRITIRQQVAKDGGDPADLSAQEVGELRLKAGLAQLTEEQMHDAVDAIIDLDEVEPIEQKTRQQRIAEERLSSGKSTSSDRESEQRNRENELKRELQG